MTVVAVLLTIAAVLAASRPRRAPRSRLRAAARRAPRAPGADVPAGRTRHRPNRGLAVLAGIAALAAATDRPAVALTACGVLVAAAARSRRHVQAARDACAAAVPHACRVLAAELSAGSLPADGLDTAAAGSPGELSAILRGAASAERLGVSASTVLARADDGCAALRQVAVCWDVCLTTGAALGRTVHGLADVFAAEIEARAVVDAELAGVRLSAAVMAGLPVFGLALGAALGADPVGFLTRSSLGRAAAASALVLDAAGFVWVRQLGVRAAA